MISPAKMPVSYLYSRKRRRYLVSLWHIIRVEYMFFSPVIRHIIHVSASIEHAKQNIIRGCMLDKHPVSHIIQVQQNLRGYKP